MDSEEYYDIRPFIHPYKPLGFLGIIKLIFSTIILLPIRLLISAIYFPLCWCLTAICLLGNPVKDIEQPLAPWRSFLCRRLVGPFCRHGFEWCLNIKVRRYGREFDPKNVTIVCNHIGYIDILWGFGEFMPSALGRAYILNVPFIGIIGRALQMLCVYTEDDQKGANSTQALGAAAALRRRQEQMQAPDSCWPPLYMFPEGTTSNGKYLLKFRTGAFLAGAPVKPVVFKFRDGPNASPTWETVPFFYHVWRFFTEWQYEVDVYYLDTYYPSEEEKKNPRLYADNVHKLMADTLGVEATDATYEGKRALHKVIREGKVKWWDIPADLKIPKPKKSETEHSKTED